LKGETAKKTELPSTPVLGRQEKETIRQTSNCNIKQGREEVGKTDKK